MSSVSIDDLEANQASLSVPLGFNKQDGTPAAIMVEYLPDRLDSAEMAAFARGRDGSERRSDANGKEITENVEFLSRVVIGWDVMDKNKQLLPITIENINRLSARVVMLLTQKIMETMMPDPNKQAASRNGLSFQKR